MPRERKNGELADVNVKVRRSSRDNLKSIKRMLRCKTLSDAIDKALIVLSEMREGQR
jgi:hypothetical protein